MDDPFFGAPLIDEDVWEDGAVRYRYVHGGFEGTDTRFAFYFPDAEHYRGRFVQFLEGGAGGHEGREAHATHGVDAFLQMAVSLGAYLVETNSGHIGMNPGPPDPTITAYRANAQSARYARELAAEMYGAAPHHGYLYGGSGGGMRTILGMEHIDDVWDGAVPFVTGGFSASDTAAPAAPRVHAGAVLGLLGPAKAAAVLDALEPGGSGDPFAGLNDVERDALDALFRGGFPRWALFQYARPSVESLYTPMWILMPLAGDPAYVDEFWSMPGYAGADGELDARLLEDKATVSQVLSADEVTARGITDHPVAVTFTGVAVSLEYMFVGLTSEQGWPADTLFANLRIESGKAAGKELTCYGTFGDVLVVGGSATYHVNDLAPGDAVVIDNRRFLAACHYHRYAEQRQTDRGDASAGNPMMRMLPMSGKFHGTMIMFNGMLDGLVPPTGGINYHEMVERQYGADTDDKFRFWWVDNTGHVGTAGPPGPRPVLQSRLVAYQGVMAHALRSLIDWVEDGVEPAATCTYRMEDGQLVLPAAAAERGGVQPVVTATVHGARRAEVAVGAPVRFEVRAETPPNAGAILSAAWDFEGDGSFGFSHEDIDGSSTEIRREATHTYDAPGTYFPAVRVSSGRADVAMGMENLARLRVVVAE